MNVRRVASELIQSTSLGYRLALALKYGSWSPKARPHAPWANTVLKRTSDVDACLHQVRRLGIPPMEDAPKNWDSLAALDIIVRATDTSASVFDAGGETYSMILPWLFLYGYRNLTAGNLVFKRSLRRGTIRYLHADITRTDFADAAFDVVTCLSVVEHGVDLDAYFKEMSRILKPGALLITSTDYFETTVDSRGQAAYGVPIHIFTADEIRGALRIAERYGLSAVSPVDLGCEEKVVHWKQFNLHYTFINFVLRKSARELRPHT